MLKLFVSHAAKDKELVEEFVNLLHVGIGVQPDSIFCSSLPGMNIPTGESFVEYIKSQVSNPELVLLLISPNFLRSQFCNNEVGASWALSLPMYPMLVPPIAYADVRGVLEGKQFAKLNQRESLNDLRDQLVSKLRLSGFSTSHWERKRDTFLVKLNSLIEETDSLPTRELLLHDLGQPANAQMAPTFKTSRFAVLPKGLRSFDINDKDYFLDLVPGPRDSNGLPECIGFWKQRIEERVEVAFSVGVIYGPSGCGKSSLVKAGLLPSLAEHVIPVYIEATGDNTEKGLLNRLRKRCPELPTDLELTKTIVALRQGRGLRQGQKVLIVLDQFEQWLHGKSGRRTNKLVQALKQCDGERVQAIVMVRDDFWLAVTRFMGELHIKLSEGRNQTLVDLFDIRHATNVLTAFGRALKRVDEPASTEQKAFVEKVVDEVAQDGRVISVRLALLIEMFKGRDWTPDDLRIVGGTEGVGVAFLEQTFSAVTAPKAHRFHERAVRGILRSLIPDLGTDIKGHMRSFGELQKASGYEGRQDQFDDLIRILDDEVRLITPTDPEGNEVVDQSKVQLDSRFYQLTHDYMVPSLRQWLTRKLKETSEGRAELLMEDCVGLWKAGSTKPLPTLQQWVEIQSLTQKEKWKADERRMMEAATHHHLETFRERLLGASTTDVPILLEQLKQYRCWADDMIFREIFSQAVGDDSPRKKLHSSLALLLVDDDQIALLYERLLSSEAYELQVIIDALKPHICILLDKLWLVVERPESSKPPQLLRAAAMLAKHVPHEDRWRNAGVSIVRNVVRENPNLWSLWGDAFRPIKNWLFEHLSRIYRDHQSERSSECSMATFLLAEYFADEPLALTQLLMDSDREQFSVVLSKLGKINDQCLTLLTNEIDQRLPTAAPSSDERREKLAKRQANAAAALLHANETAKVWPLLKHSPDPRLRSYLVHWLSPLGVDPPVIIRQLGEEADVTIRRSLLLSLGEYKELVLSPELRKTLLPVIQNLYRSEGDPGSHSAAEWLLRTWKEDDWLKETLDRWAEDYSGVNHRLVRINRNSEMEKGQNSPQWFVNSQGQTLVAIPGPVMFSMGAPEDEVGFYGQEHRHIRTIGRAFAVSSHLVTWEQYVKSGPQMMDKLGNEYSPTMKCPVNYVSWEMAACYCNWLSLEEGLSTIYKIDGDSIQMEPHYLDLNGYRLPTEAEMEYAARSGTITSRFFGETDELLSKYTWFDTNSKRTTWPVGTLKPNDLGLFDTQGNLFTWCQESYSRYPLEGDPVDDKEDADLHVTGAARVLRGGSFFNPSSHMRSAFRDFDVPMHRNSYNGFRVARSLSPLFTSGEN